MSVLPARRAFTVEEYERMFDAGILTEDDRVELLDGEIVELEPVNPPHAGHVNRLTMLFTRTLGDRAIVSVQNVLRLLPRSVPQPDVTLLVPRDDFYTTAHPQATDVFLVVEVADSSLRYDRDRKMPLYARYRIPEAWVVDVNRAEVLVHRAPSEDGYAETFAVSRGGELRIEAFPDVVYRAEDVLG